MKKSWLRGLFMCALLLAWGADALAVTCTSAAAVNNWSTVATWSCGHVPANGDDVVIIVGGTTTLDVNSNSLASLTVNGTLTIGNSVTARAMTVTGDITVAGTFAVGATAATHTLTVGGNITNTGTINFSPSGTRVCNVTFNKNGNQTVSGAGAYTFNLITLNMGATRANILDMQSTMAVPSPFLTITNGTYRHSNTSNITPWTADPSIPANGGFWLNAAATVTTTGFNVTVNGGLFRISAGTMNIGNVDTTRLLLGNAATTLFQMDGGALKVTGGINSSVATGAGTFTMSGGTITLQTIDAGAVYTFWLGSATTLNWSGGTIIATNGNAATDDIDIRSATQNITGGTLQIGSAATTSGNDISYINGAGGQLNVWNLVLASGPARNILMRSATNILNDLTIQTLNNLNPSAGLAINIGAGNTSGNWTNNGTFTQGTTTVTFTGTSATPAIGGATATTFNNLTINKASNNLTINTTPTVNGTLTFTKGDIVTGANRVILGTAATIATPSASSYVVGSIQKNYLAGAALSYFAGNDFPVGDATNFTPANISAGTTTTAGSLTVSTTATEHPQVTTPIASTGIDANKDIARYWTFNNSGLTVGTAISATFTFVAGDVDAGANTANFIVQRYDGANWNPTTLVAANALNTQVSNITPLAAGNNDFAIGEPLSGFNGIVGAFNVFEASTPAGAILGRIYTKIVGTAITLQVVAVNAGRTGVNAAYNTNPIIVDLLDARNNTGAITAATDCRSTWFPPGGPAVISTQSLSPVWTNGRSATITITAPVNAWRDVRVRVTQGANIGCSTDRFSIRPTAFTSVTSVGVGIAATNNLSSGTPIFKTGQSFNLTVTTLPTVTGYDNGSGATLANPALIPLMDNSTTPVAMVLGSPIAGTISGTFGAASGGTTTGSAFTYSEVGNFGLSAHAVFDNVFTAVDQVGLVWECTNDPIVPNDFSNVLSGSGQYGCKFGSPAVALGSGFGRFIPDHFALSAGSTLTPRSDIVACSASSFTYLDEQMSAGFTLTAQNATNGTTANYAGAFAKLNLASAASFAFGAFDSAAPTNLTSRINQALVASGTWTAGVAGVTAPVAINRNAAPDGPYNSVKLGIAPTDTDGVTLSALNIDVDNNGSNDHAQVGSTTGVSFGRLFVPNSYGTEKLNLTIPLEAQYWTGSIWATNTLDNCTSIDLASAQLANKTGALSGSTFGPPAVYFGIPATTTATMVQGLLTLTLAKPNPILAGYVDLALNLGSAAGLAQVSCPTTWVAPSPASASGLGLTYLRGQWCSANYDQDPSARITLGISRNKFIFNRENY